MCFICFCRHTAQFLQTSVHQVSNRLIVDTHYLANILVLSPVDVIKANYLALSWRQAFYMFRDQLESTILFLDVFLITDIIEEVHAVVVNSHIAQTAVVAKLIVNSVLQRYQQVRVDVNHTVQLLPFFEQFHENILNAILYQFTVGSISHPESEKTVDCPVVQFRKVHYCYTFHSKMN